MNRLEKSGEKKEGHVLTAVQTAILMAILTLGSKLIGFIREMVLAGFFGTSYVVDAYVMSSTILSVLFGGLIAAISTAYMPIFSKITETEGENKGVTFTSQIINLLLIITIIIAVMGMLFSDQIVSIFASGFVGETAHLAGFYVKVLFAYIIFSSTSAILEAYLQYRGVFLPQIISGYLISISIIFFIIISSYTSCYYLAFGTLMGYALRFIAILYISKSRGYRYRKCIQLGPKIKEILELAIPVFIGSCITSINLFIDKTLASKLVEGSISALNYASLLNNMIIGVTITILSTIIYPKLIQANSLKQYDRFNEIVGTGINIIVIIAIPCSLGAMLYSEEVIQIVYERGAFDSLATMMTSSAFRYYAIGLFFMAINDFIIRVYYSLHDMKTPMICGGISVIINVVLNVILVQFLAHNGLALATSIAALSNTLLLMIGMKKLKTNIKLIESRKKLIIVLFSAIMSVAISFIVYKITIIYFGEYIYIRTLQLFIAVLIAGISYLSLLKLFKIDEVGLLNKKRKDSF